MLRPFIVLALVAAPSIALAQEGGNPPQRIRNVQLKAGETCPKPTSPNEVVVCGGPEAEPYRIPKALREEPKQTAPSTSWAVKADRAIEDGRKVLPGSCSPIGSNGQTGCAQQAAEQWAAEKRAKANGVVEPQ